MTRTIASISALLCLAACRAPSTPPVSAASPTVAKTPAVAATRPAPEPPGTAGSVTTATPPSRLEALARADDTFESLRARYGSAVARESLPAGEGDEVAGWVLYPGDPARRVSVYPDDAGRHPASLVVRDASTWTRADGVRLGMTSTQLAALNGGAFVFYGFFWDYGGVVSDWKGGRLDGEGHGPVTLCPPDDAPDDYPSGDAEFASDAAVVAAHPAVVCEFSVVLSPAP